MDKKRVVITGLGIMSPVGSTVESFWSSLKNGKSGIKKITQFDTTDFPTNIAGEITDYDPLEYFSTKDARKMSRFIQFASIASKLAVEHAQLDLTKVDQFRFGVIVGSGIGNIRSAEEEYQKYLDRGPRKISPHFIPKIIINEAAGQVSIDLGAKGPATCVTTACSTATNAIGDAYRFMQYGDADIMVAGGTESAISILGIGGFNALKALSQRNDEPQKASRPFDLNRDGFVMSEGAGITVLETLEHAKKRGAPILAEIVGYGRTSDAFHITAPEASGDGAARAMVQAMDEAGMNPEDVSYINAHGTSTKLNDKTETKAIKTAFKNYASKVPISSTKSMTGHLLGAAGGVEFAASVLAVQHDVIPPTINLDTPDPECDLDYVPNTAREQVVNAAMSNSLGFGGHNASLLVKKFRE
ncbi:beta-ketoacyl-ACP synthase II [Candidatus Omnitrophota bacterium]